MAENVESGFYAKKFKKSGLEQLNGRWTTPVLVALVTSIITTILVCVVLPWEVYIAAFKAELEGVAGPDFSSFPFVRYFIGMFLISICVPIIEFAQLSIYPELYNSKEPVKFSEFISGFSLWGKALGAYWWKVLWLFLWELLGLVVGLALGFVIGGIAYAITKEIAALYSIIPLCAYIPAIIIVLVKSYEYYLMEFAIVDNNEIKVTQSMKISQELTRGYKWKLFCLDLSFIGWSLLTFIFPIGVLWLIPYQNTAKFSAYRYLLDEFNKKMTERIEAAAPKAIENEPVSAEVDTTDGNEC